MLRTRDGTPYRLAGSLKQFDPNNVKFDLFNFWDSTVIGLGGSPIFYYEIYITISNVDPVYMEDRSKLFSPCAVQLFAIYNPPEQMNSSSLFAIDVPDEEIILELNYQQTINIIGHLPKVGSRIYTPHRRENWIIIDVRLSLFQYWGITRLLLHCKKFQENLTTNEGKVTQDQVDYKINVKEPN